MFEKQKRTYIFKYDYVYNFNFVKNKKNEMGNKNYFKNKREKKLYIDCIVFCNFIFSISITMNEEIF